MRKLEIGPGKKRVKGFETVDAIKTNVTDYVADARALPFKDSTYDLIYASHVIEHIPWYETDALLKEWFRVLAVGGALEVWTIDALKVAKALVDYEGTGRWAVKDGWTRYGVHKDPYRWCSGRLFAYGKADDEDDSVNWHRALFTPRYLQACFKVAGFTDVRLMDRKEVRGYDHGWVNLGVRGMKA